MLAGALALRAHSSPPQTTPVAAVVDFTRDIQPILEKNCYECHGPRKARGRLRLHAGAFIRRGGVSGPVIEAGRGDQSLLIQRVLGQGADDQMPLDRDPLPPAAIALLKAWIDQGAPLPATDSTSIDVAENVEEHWAYLKPVRPELPAVTNRTWARNPIDRFVLAQLEHEHLLPSVEADKATILRRVTLDLTGLPPTRAELEAFLADRHPMPTNGSSTGCWRRRTMASAGRARGWIWRATPTPTATRRTTGGRSGNTATGSSTRSTATCRSTGSRSSRSPATCCRTPRPTRRSPAASIATP